MDALDTQILETLRRNARKPITEISKSLGVSDVTVHSRIRELINSGLIKGFTTDIDYEQLGYSVTAFVRLGAKPSDSNAIAQTLERLPWVIEIYEISSKFDLLLKIKATSLRDLRTKMAGELATIENVLSVDVTPVLNVRKESSMPVATVKAIRGESGELHEFNDVASDGTGVPSLVDRYDTEVTEREILISYVKALDVKSKCSQIVASSYTKEAVQLAGFYKIELKDKSNLENDLR